MSDWRTLSTEANRMRSCRNLADRPGEPPCWIPDGTSVRPPAIQRQLPFCSALGRKDRRIWSKRRIVCHLPHHYGDARCCPPGLGARAEIPRIRPILVMTERPIPIGGETNHLSVL